MENEKGIVKLTRQQIYDDIWKMSVAGVARKYNLHYAHLIESCKEADIPFPTSGYWTRKNCGKDVSSEVVSLSGDGSILVDLTTNDSVVKRIKKRKAEEKTSVKEDFVAPENEAESEKKPKDNEIVVVSETRGILEFLEENEREKVLNVACSLEINENTSLHKALVQYKKRISEYNVKLKNAQSQRYYNPRYNKPENEPDFFKEVSEDSIKRVMAILDSLFKAVYIFGV